jgi:hypothetical protein
MSEFVRPAASAVFDAGKPGEQGRGISAAEIDAAGDLILTYTDFSVVNVGRVVAPLVPGKDGRDGIDGRDGTNGKDGDRGLPGANGLPGLRGDPGLRGEKGEPGIPGRDGIDGVNGIDGANGRDGAHGSDGLPGARGHDGTNGRDGLPGKDGTNGRDGEKGAPGAAGERGEKGDPGEKGEPGMPGIPGKDAPPGQMRPRGRTLLGTTVNGSPLRLTADRKPPTTNNTMNLPDGFGCYCRIVVVGMSGNKVELAIDEGVLSRGDGPETTQWTGTVLTLNNPAVVIAADTENGGLAVTVTGLADARVDWTCRVDRVPE